MTFDELVRACEEAARKSQADGALVPVERVFCSQETLRMWKANCGNSKTRRRWRRREVPNRQREEARQ